MLAAEDRKQSVSISAAWNGTGTAPAGTVVVVSAGAGSVLAVEITGTFTATLAFEGTIDESTWFAITGQTTAGATATSATAAGRWFFQYAGLRAARVRCSAWTSGTPVVTMNVGAGSPAGAIAGNAAAIVAGTLTHNNAAPAANNVGVLPALATAVSPSYTEGDQVLHSVDLSGLLRVKAAGFQAVGTAVASNPVIVAGQFGGNVKLLGLDTNGGIQQGAANAAGTASWPVQGAAAAAAAIAGNPLLMGGSDGTNARALLMNTSGNPLVLAGGFAPAAPTCTFTRPGNATPYTIGDEVGTASTAPTTISVARINGGSGVIQGAQVIYSNNPATTPQLVLIVMNATGTLQGDNAQCTLSDADALKIVAVIPLTTTQALAYSAGAVTTTAALHLQGVPATPAHFVCGGSEQTLYCFLITLNAFTPIANSETLTVLLQVEQN